MNDNQATDYNLLALSMVSTTYYKQGVDVKSEDLKALLDLPADEVNWPAVVGALLGLSWTFLTLTDDPEQTLKNVALILNGANFGQLPEED